jgi:ferric iron reductase protein FhuF
VDAALAPILTTLEAVRARHGEQALNGLVPGLVLDRDAEQGWVPATDLLERDGITDLLDTAKQRWSAQPHVAAALAWKSYTYWLALPAVLGYAAARRVPVVTPDNVLVRYSGHQPFLRVALRRPEVVAVPGDDPAPLREMLVDQHLTPVLASIRGLVHIGHRTMWGSVASGVAYALSRAAGALPGSVLETAGTLLTALDAADLVDLREQPDGSLAVRRRTCCLAFTLPEPKVCTGCCIRD